jgi:nucleoside-diphosphate-sugar epimerase
VKIAVTGGSGRVGRAVLDRGLELGHELVNVDRQPPPPVAWDGRVAFRQLATGDYTGLRTVFEGCAGLIHLAAIPWPDPSLPDHEIHNTNAAGSYNALHAAIAAGVTRVCQASSVNAIGHEYSRPRARYDYFPVDEDHPSRPTGPYGLSKQIAEVQADSLAREHPGVTVVSLRFHWVVADRAEAARAYVEDPARGEKCLWAYTRSDEAVEACYRALTADLGGHEVFFVVAPDTASDRDSAQLATAYYPDVARKPGFSGRQSFFDSGKAGRRLFGPR